MNETKTISRRSFLKGAVAGGVSMAAASILGACSTDTTECPAPSEDTNVQVEQGFTWERQPEPIDASLIAETLSADVVVIGAGVAGMSAARAASEGGKKVIVIEKAKNVVCRGNFGCQIGAVDTFLHKQKGTVVDKDYLLQRFCMDTLGMNDAYFTKYWIDHSAETLDWMLAGTKGYVVEAEDPTTLEDGIVSISGANPTGNEGRDLRYPEFSTKMNIKCNDSGLSTGGFTPMLENFAAIVEANGGQMIYCTFAKQLVKTGNAVTGVIAQKQDGTYIQVNASQVVLATGDFANNEEMCNYFAPQTKGMLRLFNSMDCNDKVCNTGDGHIMAMWAGAHMEAAPYAPMAHLSTVNDILLVNCYGERVCNEDLGAQTITNTIMHQPKQKVYAISGNKRGVVKLDPGPFSPKNEETYAENEIDKLAAYIGETCNVETLKATIKSYNEICRNKKDTEYSKDPKYLVELDYPLHCNESGPGSLLVIMGGIECNRNCQALDSEYNPIEGLFVVGNVQGGRFGAEYPMTAPGISHGIAFTLGKKVGDYLATL